MKELSRDEREKLYIKKMTELQTRWGNNINDDWDFSDWTDEQLNESLAIVIKQLKFEKAFFIIRILLCSLVILLIAWAFN